MKIVVLNFTNGEVDVATLSDTSTQEQIEEYVSSYDNDSLEYMVIKDVPLRINFL